jgi:hypothetical protein
VQRLVGWLLMGVGALALLAGAVTAAAFGTDDNVTLGPHRFTGTGCALVTAPRVISFAGPTLTLTATLVHSHAPVFIGVGSDVDVRDYLQRASYTRVDSVSLPWRVDTTMVNGPRSAVADPRALDWWLTTAAYPHKATAAVPLPDAPIDVVVMDLAGTRSRNFTVDVVARITIPGSFAGGLAVAVAGVGLLAAGAAIRRATSRTPSGVPAPRRIAG